MACYQSIMQEPSIDTDKLSYEIFSILESKFLFGYDDKKVWIPNEISSENTIDTTTTTTESVSVDNSVSAIKNQRGKVCILSIDGGGMRGILSGKALAYLEQALKIKSGNSDACVADYFDVAAGSGVGGVFTAMLFASKADTDRPIFKAEDTWQLLAQQDSHKFYCSSASYSPRKKTGFFCGLPVSCRTGGDTGSVRSVRSATVNLEKAMKERFTENGRSLTLKDTMKPVLIPCYDLSSSAPFLFSRADAFESESFNFRLWEVCRATSAEPAVFEPVEMKSLDEKTQCVAIDGGLAMSNPTAAAITHVLHNKQEFPFVRGVEDVLVLSLGSGQLFESSCNFDQVKGWKAKDWARPMARIAGDGAADLVDHAVSMAFGQSRSCNYVRIQANGPNLKGSGANVDHDSSPSNVEMLVGVAEEMMKQKNVESVLFGGKRIGEQTNMEKIDWFAGELVLEHQRRSCRIAPTVAFKQATTTKST